MCTKDYFRRLSLLTVSFKMSPLPSCLIWCMMFCFLFLFDSPAPLTSLTVAMFSVACFPANLIPVISYASLVVGELWTKWIFPLTEKQLFFICQQSERCAGTDYTLLMTTTRCALGVRYRIGAIKRLLPVVFKFKTSYSVTETQWENCLQSHNSSSASAICAFHTFICHRVAQYPPHAKNLFITTCLSMVNFLWPLNA